MAKLTKEPKMARPPITEMDVDEPHGNQDSADEFSSEEEWEETEAASEDDESHVKQEDDVEDEDDDEAEDENENEDEDEDGEPEAKRARTAEEEEKLRQSRAEQKQAKQERKASKPNAPLIQEAKAIWETLRQKKLSARDRKSEMKALMDLVRGKVKDIIFKHDASRIIQCALKYGDQKQRDEIAGELKGHYAELSKSVYGRFIISKILSYCSADYRGLVVKDFYGKIRKIVRHKEAAIILEEAYVQSNGTERNKLLEEFYGPEFALFKNAGGRSIEELIAETPEKKPVIVKHLREVLNSVLEKGFTNIGHLTIVHRAILEYMTFAEEKQMVDLIELLKEHLVTILHTREGARVAQLCILHSGPKDRKLIIKSLKSFVVKIAKEQYGHAVLITIFECVDDTVLVDKAILSELMADGLTPGDFLTDLLMNRYASRVIMFLLSGRNRKIQPPYLIKELEEMDAVRARTSKKDDALRKEQLLKAVSPPLLKVLEERCDELVRDLTSGAVVVEAVFHAHGDKTTLLRNIAKLAGGAATDVAANGKSDEPFNAIKKLKADVAAAKQQEEGIDMNEHVMVGRATTYILKDIFAPRRKFGAPATAEKPESLEFSKLLAAELKPNVAYWLRRCAEDPKRTSGTAFVFVALLERGAPEARKTILDAVKKEKKLDEQLQKRVAVRVAEQAAEAKAAGGDADEKPTAGKRKRKTNKDKATPAPGAVQASSGIQTFLRVYSEMSKA
ncbi:hypothetical protein HDU87_002436 [Geranomyces variabilis]|uniref:PUM-HD domain-containing protein n=1 Tax=Geranomyces variabilis TaxID=109894 RepID=A0AAD5TR84_9FUNG|nr:hypothetical protein HDU87_002436 [Geranomyces variabilis]